MLVSWPALTTPTPSHGPLVRPTWTTPGSATAPGCTAPATPGASTCTLSGCSSSSAGSRVDAELVLCAALWHDIGRQGDGVEPEHGRRSAERADELGLTAKLSSADAAIARFAILRHSLPDSGAAPLAAELAASEDEARLAEPERALRVLWVLKDADALDRVRLGFDEGADPRQLRHRETIDLIPFASTLYALLV